MSHSADSHRPSSTGLRAVTVAMLAVFSIQLGCSRAPAATSPLSEAREAVASRIVSRDVEAARTVDGVLERYGRLGVALGDETPRMLSFVLRQALVRGTQDAVLEVHDEETGARTVYVLNDETGDAWVHTDTGTHLHMVFNADKTILVGNKLAANEEAAARILVDTGALADVSQYSLFTMIDVVSQYLPEGQTSRGGGAVVLAAVAIWFVGSSVACTIEYRNRGCNVHALSNYCRSWCISRLCFC